MFLKESGLPSLSQYYLLRIFVANYTHTFMPIKKYILPHFFIFKHYFDTFTPGAWSSSNGFMQT